MPQEYSLPPWLIPKTEPWQVIAQAGEQIGNALARQRDFKLRAEAVQQENVLRARESDLREKSQTLRNQALLQDMNRSAIDMERESANQPLLEQYQRRLMTWTPEQGDPPMPPPSLPPKLMQSAIGYRNELQSSEGMLQRKKLLGDLAAQEMKFQNDMLKSAMELRELTGVNAVEFDPKFGPRVNAERLDAGWKQYRDQFSNVAGASGMTPTTVRRPTPGGGYTTYSLPRPPMTKEQYRLSQFAKRKEANLIGTKERRALTDADVIRELDAEYDLMVKRAAAAPQANAPTGGTTSAYRAGQRAIQNGVLYEFNGMDWVEVK